MTIVRFKTHDRISRIVSYRSPQLFLFLRRTVVTRVDPTVSKKTFCKVCASRHACTYTVMNLVEGDLQSPFLVCRLCRRFHPIISPFVVLSHFIHFSRESFQNCFSTRVRPSSDMLVCLFYMPSLYSYPRSPTRPQSCYPVHHFSTVIQLDRSTTASGIHLPILGTRALPTKLSVLF